MDDLFGPGPSKPRVMEPAVKPVVLTNMNGAMRCRAPGCGADASFGFGIGARSSTWFCLVHRPLGAEVLRDRP